MTRGSLALLPILLLAMLAAGLARRPGPAADMAAAARRWLDALDAGERARAVVPFDAPAREDWHYIPRTRPGLTLGEMDDRQRAVVRGLLTAALSARGVLKVEAIMALDTVLRDLARAAGRSGASRDPLAYTFTIYGDPGAEPWGWKIEGHHVSLNFTVAGGRVAVTPAFLGANPAQIRSGPQAGARALALEEDLAFALLESFDDAQRADATVDDDAPRDILTSPGRPLDLGRPRGVAHADMTPAQRATLERLIEEYVHNFRPDLAGPALERIREEAGAIRFAWAGSRERGRGHYYRITGPTFIIEYDNTQDGANHVHCVWHDPERSFGRDLLGEHFRRDHGGR